MRVADFTQNKDSNLASILINADWSASPETKILKYILNYPIGQLWWNWGYPVHAVK